MKNLFTKSETHSGCKEVAYETETTKAETKPQGAVQPGKVGKHHQGNRIAPVFFHVWHRVIPHKHVFVPDCMRINGHAFLLPKGGWVMEYQKINDYYVGITTRGDKFYFDESDYSQVSQYAWHKQGVGYVHAQINGKKVMLHRLLLDAQKGQQCDHINGNRVDCRRSNLRVCTHAENQRNSKKRPNSSSTYKGVSWDKNLKKWLACIRVNGKTIYIGVFISEVDAARAYNAAAVKYHKEFARINIIGQETPTTRAVM